MTANRYFERINRTARDPYAFSGGHRYTGKILPMDQDEPKRWWRKG